MMPHHDSFANAQRAGARRRCARAFTLRAAAGLLALVALLAEAGSPALAQSPPASATSSADQLLQRGLDLRHDGRDTDALVLFRQALELDPESARVFAHLGVTYQALGRWVLADTYLSQALARAGDPYIERHRAALEQASALVKDHLGLLDVQGDPAGAEILLNGQSFGQLPLAEPVRVPVGSYLMEVSLAGHYGMSQPIRISPRALTRESVELLPLSARAQQAKAAPKAAPDEDANSEQSALADERQGTPAWVPWTLAGISAAAVAVTTVALVNRQQHADRWHDNSRCLNVPGATRESLCADERSAGQHAQTVALVSGGVALAFAAGALWTGLSVSSSSSEQAGLESCSIGLAGALCSGHF